ncbi:S53 family peptidase [Streptantibioticus ferralitis]|uniref:S53 family peptidase n=1 Tax=Streptantibioticus ferralitis TaxID=236510 RepID=A0ABT5YXB9_9ACTN|nr:S53 family peptidase [Streptantibioticus ferralitis]MDF2256190.1 S53 family peptidase [Streptantibioticus ferralitis]
MHISSPSAHKRKRGLRKGTIAAASLSALVAGTYALVAPAGAASTTSATASQPQVKRMCSQPSKPGMMACLGLVRTDMVKHHVAGANDTPQGFGPDDLRKAYNLTGDGSGQTVAIVDAQDDPNAAQDLAAYRKQYGLPDCGDGCFKKIDQNGGTNYPSADAGWAGEISLDLDMVSAIAPKANILLVEANSANMSDLGAAVNQAVKSGAKFVSNSYGGGEDASDAQADTQYFNHPGVVITASAGDSGFGVEYPAASPNVTSVGGTSLTKDSSSRGWTEKVWGTSGGGEGTGSGCSTVAAKPSWQKDTGCAKRTVADVSAVADPATGVAVYDTYQSNGWQVVGGTSASSPIIASVYALAGAPSSGSNPASFPYKNPSALNDVTSGSNGSCNPSYLCNAGQGYDGPTGLGTPNGLKAFTG